MKIKVGDKISELSLPNIDGTEFDLVKIQGKKALISFYRYSSCPFCHLRINETINNKIILVKDLKLSLYLIAHLKVFKSHLQNMKHQFISSLMRIENILTSTVFKKVELEYLLVQ